jgi:hypothetical protein
MTTGTEASPRSALALRLLYVFAILVLAAIALPRFLPPRVTLSQNACANNLRWIAHAKDEWARANGKTNGEEVAEAGVDQYIRDEVAPKCPSGGVYIYGAVGDEPLCSMSNSPGHRLVGQTVSGSQSPRGGPP